MFSRIKITEIMYFLLELGLSDRVSVGGSCSIAVSTVAMEIAVRVRCQLSTAARLAAFITHPEHWVPSLAILNPLPTCSKRSKTKL